MSNELWHGFKQEVFEFEGRKAILVYPDTPNENNSWTLKMEYWDAFADAEVGLLKKGFHCAYLENTSRFAPKCDCEAKARFAEYLHKEKGLSAKCALVGMSLGGAHSFNFAGMYPELVSCMYIDAPVMSFVSYPAKLGDADCEKIWNDEFLKAYPGMTRAKLFTFDNHPISKVDIIKEHKIPILMLYGTEDQTVIYEENGKLLELEYEGSDLLTVIPRTMQGHHPHGAGRFVEPIVEYISEHSANY